jgi:hypothetical protein
MMRMLFLFVLASLILGVVQNARGAEVTQELPPALALTPPPAESMAGFTLVDWVNGLAFDLDPRTRAVVQPQCNLLGGFTLAWPEADTDCNPEAIFEPAFALDISVYHSYLLATDSRAELDANGLRGAEELGGQAALDELQAGQMAETGRCLAGGAVVRLADGTELAVPYYTWREEDAAELGWCLEYAVWQPGSLSGPQIVTVTLRSASEPGPELIELATARLRLFQALQV